MLLLLESRYYKMVDKYCVSPTNDITSDSLESYSKDRLRSFPAKRWTPLGRKQQPIHNL